MNEIIIKLIIYIIAAVVAMVLTKLKVVDAKWCQLIEAIEYAVRAAEQLYTPKDNTMKKQYVTVYIKELLNEKLKLNVTDQELNVLIEGAVNAIKHPIV